MHLKKHERLCENKDYFSVEMPTKLNKISKYNHGEKSLKTPFPSKHLLVLKTS